MDTPSIGMLGKMFGYNSCNSKEDVFGYLLFVVSTYGYSESFIQYIVKHAHSKSNLFKLILDLSLFGHFEFGQQGV